MILKKKTKKGLNTKTFFAFLPVKCGSEVKWLEKVKISYDVYGSERLGYWNTNKKFICMKEGNQSKSLKFRLKMFIVASIVYAIVFLSATT
jgi:hypothetical protein